MTGSPTDRASASVEPRLRGQREVRARSGRRSGAIAYEPNADSVRPSERRSRSEARIDQAARHAPIGPAEAVAGRPPEPDRCRLPDPVRGLRGSPAHRSTARVRNGGASRGPERACRSPESAGQAQRVSADEGDAEPVGDGIELLYPSGGNEGDRRPAAA